MSRTSHPQAATPVTHPAPARPLRRPSRRSAALALGAGTVAALLAGVVAGGPASAATSPRKATQKTVGPIPVPSVPTGLPTAIEDLAPYVKQVSCDPAAKPGAIALGRLLATTYPGTGYVVGHDCGTEPIASEHVDGRAVDWIVSARSATQKAQAQAFLDWLFAPDPGGRAYANARRMGVMYVIWNDRIWGAWKPLDGWSDYSTCPSHPDPGADAVCHRNRMHISLSWDGATARTSFWSRTVSAPDYGPCRPKDLNWSPAWTAPNRRPCAEYPVVTASARASAVLTALVKYSGATVGRGSAGPVVTAVQRALGIPADGRYGPFTAEAVTDFQRTRSLSATGVMDAATWRALLAVHALSGPVDAVKPPASALAKYRTTVLKLGDKGPAVAALQAALKITSDGRFGPATRAAVIRLQKRVGLKPTGVVDTATWRALGA